MGKTFRFDADTKLKTKYAKAKKQSKRSTKCSRKSKWNKNKNERVEPLKTKVHRAQRRKIRHESKLFSVTMRNSFDGKNNRAESEIRIQNRDAKLPNISTL